MYIFPTKNTTRAIPTTATGLLHTSKPCIDINATKLTRLRPDGARQPQAEAYVLAQINTINLGMAGNKGIILY